MFFCTHSFFAKAQDKIHKTDSTVIEAKVLEILDSDLTFAGSSRDSNFLYIVGEIVKVDNFDTNRWNECSTGIHFFLTKREAELYN